VRPAPVGDAARAAGAEAPGTTDGAELELSAVAAESIRALPL
jgi:hypothetical protein